MSWPVILSGVVCVAMLALGFNLLLPLGSGLARVVYSAEFAVKIGRLDVQFRQRARQRRSRVRCRRSQRGFAAR